ncbi:hypothetical protein [Rheinheimera sp.]|uniref:hypothetical protein n=1 Tax=Rheinheimera sp. TaxID=1869214 RepID=UPI00307CCBFE
MFLRIRRFNATLARHTLSTCVVLLPLSLIPATAKTDQEEFQTEEFNEVWHYLDTAHKQYRDRLKTEALLGKNFEASRQKFPLRNVQTSSESIMMDYGSVALTYWEGSWMYNNVTDSTSLLRLIDIKHCGEQVAIPCFVGSQRDTVMKRFGAELSTKSTADLLVYEDRRGDAGANYLSFHLKDGMVSSVTMQFYID